MTANDTPAKTQFLGPNTPCFFDCGRPVSGGHTVAWSSHRAHRDCYDQAHNTEAK